MLRLQGKLREVFVKLNEFHKEVTVSEEYDVC